MSWQMTERVLKHSRARGSARLVLVSIASHAHADGTGSYPAVETIAREANLSKREVFRSLSRLRDLGEITIEPRGVGPGTPNLYAVILPANRDEMSPLEETPATGQGDQMSPLTVTSTPLTVTSTPPNRDVRSREPSSNPPNLQGTVPSEEAAQAQRKGTTEERGTGTPASRRVQGTHARAITVAGPTKTDADDVVDAYLAVGGGTSEYARFKVGKEAELLLREGVDRTALLVAVRLLATTKREPWELRQLVVRAGVAL